MVQVEGLVAGKLAAIAEQSVKQYAKQEDFGKHVQMTELKLDELKRQVGGRLLHS